MKLLANLLLKNFIGGLKVKWFNLGKRNRSKLAEFLDRNDLTQQDLADESGVSKSTISRVCQGDKFSPTMRNAQKIIKALKKLTGKKVDYDDFWTM
ncbi:helix-turn-helix transcriptional regulator [Bacillus paranthracis]|uniref:helix-turn-helix transcriptional regulator n=1 Tax=Bacillus paranthracis TaxID=2026186 RepID=UPI0012B86D62|nr:helix-turn-helix transcriptional regulator [Bacillus paranthracis]MEC3360535.1 helix-turn-helix transcriptional regulator [Bacillus paranthracis]MED0786614.1 helix-turn-helix transcriptional regulator [Bacillus paranthracis]MED0813181.1 helix-turn-helix transcriptional regulator [Bacillus paranthracis]MED0862255.1 helix-turn-helix transcriptional regulator [Bacillus paranthracis]MED1247019.1 helix-turn-helix transcriptional regulator [Bacillus paranthracis]